ncbi:MAG: helix-turn-helix transcriptional regulator [Candidatus Acidiferrales bacterium]
MVIGDRLRSVREEKKLSQGDIEKRTGLLRCYISRVENGYTVPTVETIEKFARALEIPTYQIFYDGDEAPEPPQFTKREAKGETAWGSTGKNAGYLAKFRRLLGKMTERDRNMLFSIAQKIAAQRSDTGRRHPAA